MAFVVLNSFRFYPADAWQPRFITTNTPVKNAPKVLPVIRAYFIRKSKRFLLHFQAGNAYLQIKSTRKKTSIIFDLFFNHTPHSRFLSVLKKAYETDLIFQS